MFTIAVLLLGIKIVNWHGTLPFTFTGSVSFNPTFGPVALEINIAPALTPAAGSKEVKPLPAQIPITPSHPDVTEDPTSFGDPLGQP